MIDEQKNQAQEYYARILNPLHNTFGSSTIP